MWKKSEINSSLRQPIDTIVHLGAGRCSELEDYLELKPRKLLLVEADSELAEELEERTASQSWIDVKSLPVSGRPGSSTFHRYNLSDFNGLHPATGLKEIFPGLKEIERLSVDTVDPAELLQPLELDSQKENCLVVDIPGEELSVLQALQRPQQLYLFNQVQLYCGRGSLYEGSESADSILKWITGEGFDLVAEDDSRDPDRPCWSLRRNDLYLVNRNLVQQVKKLQAEVKQLTKDRDTQGELADEHQDQIVQLTRIRDEQGKLVEEQQSRIEQLSKARDEEARITSDLKAMLEQANRDKKELVQKSEERQKKIASLEQKAEESGKQIDELQSKMRKAVQERDAQSKVASERQAQIEKVSKARDVLEAKAQLADSIPEKDAEIGKLKTALQEAKKRASELETQLPEMEHRQHLLKDELVKAEGQIDLIKDLLLREPGL